MAAVRSSRNRSTERRLRALFVQSGIRGWTLDGLSLSGKPDFVFPNRQLVVFIDGCFWHGCPKCCRMPEENADYWRNKIEHNALRDRSVTRRLRRDGWRVVRLWEHDLRRDRRHVDRLLRELMISA